MAFLGMDFLGRIGHRGLGGLPGRRALEVVLRRPHDGSKGCEVSSRLLVPYSRFII